MNTSLPIRIGTRDSPLAMWQAQKVQQLLTEQGLTSELVPVKSEGDLDLVTPLYAMGVQGVFSKTLDAFLLSNHIDIAVHSMKDVPVQLAQGIVQAAVLKRASTEDVIVWKDQSYSFEDLEKMDATIGTGSIRRQSFWHKRYPHHQVENLRGNVQTRLRKLQESNWVGAIFAKAGLERMEMQDLNMTSIDWMLSAPAQGAILVVCRGEDEDLRKTIETINHAPTAICVKEERNFLAALHGGCSTPIGAKATVVNDTIQLEGCISNLAGTEMMHISKTAGLQDSSIGDLCAQELLSKGADVIVQEIRNSL